MANIADGCVVSSIGRLRPEMASQKTEAMFIHMSRGQSPPAWIMVGTIPVQIGLRLKYLSLTWTVCEDFRIHFKLLTPG